MICPFCSAIFELSDDIAFRFGNQGWNKYPLTADTYADWIRGTSGDLVDLFLDYETFGEHFWKETGILNFLSYLPTELEKRGIRTTLPTEALESYPPVGTIDVKDTISWADIEKDASAWMGNERQHTAYSAIQKAAAFAKDKEIWRYLQTSDHFYYMASKYGTSVRYTTTSAITKPRMRSGRTWRSLPILRNVTYGRRRTKNRQRPSGH